VRFQVLSDSKKVKYLPAYTYWWYKSNTILRTTGGADGRLLNGEYVCFYPDNNLKEKGSFFKGVKDKLWISWYSNGKISEQVTWKKGVINGERFIYDKDGKILLKERYVNGKLKKGKAKPDSKSNAVSATNMKPGKEKSDKARPAKDVAKRKAHDKINKPATSQKGATITGKSTKQGITDKKKK
jgi:antitoxin component YwqK of YwqJK toxin-antitoxin module